MEFSQRLVNLALRLYRFSFVKVMRKTMIALFPFAALGSIASVINVSILSSAGFIGNVFYITKWLPHVARIRSMFATFSMLTVKILAVLAAYQAARYTTKLYHKNNQMAGITGMLAFLIIALRPIQQSYNAQTFLQFNVNNRLIGMQGIFMGVVVGFIVGQIFRLMHKQSSIHADSFEKNYQMIFPILVSLTLAIIVNQIFIEIYRYQVPQAISAYYQSLSSKKHGLLMTVILGGWTSFLAWFGFIGPYSTNSFNDDPAAVADLTYALKHHSPWNVPYKYTQTTLYHSFGTLGGVGTTLALVIAIILVAKTTRYHRVARWSIFPVLFNASQPILLGIPVLLNPLYIVPFIATPVLNMLIAALAIHLHIMPPVTYPTPLDTPGVLSAFIGTGGNFAALLIGILALVIDVLLYIPFVKLSEQIEVRIIEQSPRLQII